MGNDVEVGNRLMVGNRVGSWLPVHFYRFMVCHAVVVWVRFMVVKSAKLWHVSKSKEM